MKIELTVFRDLPRDVPAAVVIHADRVLVALNPTVERNVALDAAEEILAHWQETRTG